MRNLLPSPPPDAEDGRMDPADFPTGLVADLHAPLRSVIRAAEPRRYHSTSLAGPTFDPRPDGGTAGRASR